MTITAAETPRLANGAERKVWDALTDQLEPGDLVIPGKRVTDHLKDHEIDFFVAIEGAGVVCLEVKGGEVWHDGRTWRQKRRGREAEIEPVRQAREACYALRSFIESDERWTQGRLRWDHVVVLPNTDLPDDFALPECPRWKVIDRTDLPDIVTKLREILHAQELDRPLLSRAGIAQLSESLSGRGLPQRTVVSRALENEDAADILTEHQAVILDAVRLLNRVEIRGGAGSGKPSWRWSRLAASRVPASGSLWSAIPTAWRPTWNASPPPGTGASNRPTSESSTTSARSGAHLQGPMNPFALRRPCSSGKTTCRCRWPTSRRTWSRAIGSTRSSSTRPKTSRTPGGIRCWPR